MKKKEEIIQIDHVACVVTPEKQEYTSAEMGIPGIKLFGHFTSNKAHKALGLHRHPGCIEISYYVTGNQIYRTTEKEYFLTGNTVFIAQPGEPHGIASDSEGKVEVYWIQFETAFFENFLALHKPFSCDILKFLLNQKKHLIKCKKNLKPMLENALENIPKENIYSKFSGLSSLFAFLSELIEYNDFNYSGRSVQIEKSITYIIDNIENKISLEEIAEFVGLSLSHFKKRFKLEIGDTPNNYINSLKIEKAKEMLKLKQFSITEIAYKLDFSSSAYFSVVFKHHTNISPKEFISRLNLRF